MIKELSELLADLPCTGQNRIVAQDPSPQNGSYTLIWDYFQINAFTGKPWVQAFRHCVQFKSVTSHMTGLKAVTQISHPITDWDFHAELMSSSHAFFWWSFWHLEPGGTIKLGYVASEGFWHQKQVFFTSILKPSGCDTECYKIMIEKF